MHHCHLDRIGNSPSHSGLHSASYFHVGRNWVGRVYSLLYRGLVWSGNLPELHSSSYICVSLKKLWAWALNFSSHQVTCPGVEMDWIGPQKLCQVSGVECGKPHSLPVNFMFFIFKLKKSKLNIQKGVEKWATLHSKKIHSKPLWTCPCPW